jgi:hypothetical protein
MKQLEQHRKKKTKTCTRKLTQQSSKKKPNEMKHSSHIFEIYKRQGNINKWSISICIEDQIIQNMKRKEIHTHTHEGNQKPV